MCIINNLKNRLTNIFKGKLLAQCVYADYYNNSENDLENIFVELTKLSNQPICFLNKDFFADRVRFLANEGLNIIFSQDLKVIQSKLNNSDIENIIAQQVKTTKKKKKTVKKKI